MIKECKKHGLTEFAYRSDGIIVAMGGKVEKELKKHQISHLYIHHPTARGKIRIIENYKEHVKEQLNPVLN